MICGGWRSHNLKAAGLAAPTVWEDRRNGGHLLYELVVTCAEADTVESLDAIRTRNRRIGRDGRSSRRR